MGRGMRQLHPEGAGALSLSSTAAPADSAAPTPSAAAGLAKVHRKPATMLDARSPTPLIPFRMPNAVPRRRSSTNELVSDPLTELTTGFRVTPTSAIIPIANHSW